MPPIPPPGIGLLFLRKLLFVVVAGGFLDLAVYAYVDDAKGCLKRLRRRAFASSSSQRAREASERDVEAMLPWFSN